MAAFRLSQGTALFPLPDFSKVPIEDFKHLGDYGQLKGDFPVTLTCNQVLFSQCNLQWNTNAGLVGPFNTPGALARALRNKVITQGTRGILQVCK